MMIRDGWNMGRSSGVMYTVKVPIDWERMTGRQRRRLEKMTRRDTRVIRAYLGVIEHHEREILYVGQRRRVDAGALDRLTLRTRDRKSVPHDFKIRFPNISTNELQECRETAIGMWEAYLVTGQTLPLHARTRRPKKIPRHIFRRLFTLVYAPEKTIKHWLVLRDSLRSAREGRRRHDRLAVPLRMSGFHLSALRRGDVRSVQILKDRRRKWWALLRVFGRITRLLQHRLRVAGLDPNRVRMVPEYWTSTTCSRCGRRGLRPKQSFFLCPTCGYRANADVNAAINIGQRLIRLIPSLWDEDGLGQWLSARFRPETVTPKARRSTRSQGRSAHSERSPASPAGVTVADRDEQTLHDESGNGTDPAMARTMETPSAAVRSGTDGKRMQREEAERRARDYVLMTSTKHHDEPTDDTVLVAGDGGHGEGGAWELRCGGDSLTTSFNDSGNHPVDEEVMRAHPRDHILGPR